MSEPSEHHTQEQVDAAFRIAPVILRKLVADGVKMPRFELFADASGKLILGDEGDVTNEQVEYAVGLVHSRRFGICYECLNLDANDKREARPHKHEVAIQFCCGLVVEAGVHTD